MRFDPKTLSDSLPFSVRCFEEVDSTSLYLKERIKQGEVPEGLVIASYQSNGQGRTGKRFYSPSNSGLYLTFCFQEEDVAVSHLTPRIALSVVCALERLFPVHCGVKWVNDVYIDGRKVSGVLCQKFENFVLIGIGINVEKPLYIPEDLKNRLGYVCEACEDSRFTELVLELYHQIVECLKIDESNLLSQYRKSCIHIGKEIEIEQDGKALSCECIGIDDNFSLLVSLNGEIRSFTSGYIILKV